MYYSEIADLTNTLCGFFYRTMIASRLFPRGHLIRCLAYDPKGMYLGMSKFLFVLKIEEWVVQK